MEIRQTQKFSQKLALTPQMRQSIQILQLGIMDLKEYLENFIEENPVIEREGTDKSLEEPLSEEHMERLLSLGDRESGIDQQSFTDSKEAAKKHDYQQSLITKEQSLQEFLLRQLRLHTLSKAEALIGEHIIADIDENGYLKSSASEIWAALEKRKEFKDQGLSKDDVEEMIALIQTFEPSGVGARNLKECLVLQLKTRKHDPLLLKIIDQHLPDVARHDPALIAKKLKKPLADVERAIRTIAALEPKPGRLVAGQEHVHRKAATPDIIVEKVAGKYEILLNMRGLPKLAINKRYQELLKSDTVPQDLEEYLSQKLKSAIWLIKAVLLREETIRKIARCILNVQKDFLEHGDPSLIKPLTLKEVARIIKRNESTVSRVVNNKYIQTPAGTFKLDSFFSTSLESHNGEKISTKNVKSLIYELVTEENPVKPLRDAKIVSLLAAQGIPIARRTVAKYREELKIPPYHERKKKRA